MWRRHRIDRRQQKAGLIRPMSIDRRSSHVGAVRHASGGHILRAVGEQYVHGGVEDYLPNASRAGIHPHDG